MAYWLMKSEPEAFSIQDLKRIKRNMWDGVRNYQARNYMWREMKVGDEAFFYHSNASPSGIAGICRIASKPYADPTQFDPRSKYYDEKSTEEKPRWYLVDVEFASELPLIALEQLRNNPKLHDMKLLARGSRLSIQPVTKTEWQEVLNMVKVAR